MNGAMQLSAHDLLGGQMQCSNLADMMAHSLFSEGSPSVYMYLSSTTDVLN